MPHASTTENNSVDRRAVSATAQAETLLDAAGRLGQRAEHLKAFFLPLLRSAAPVGGGHAPRAKGRSIPTLWGSRSLRAL